MPRPALSDLQLVETRARIIAEAGHIIAAEGYAALSMRRLASTVGLTAGALYRYFPNKHHVLVSYCVEALDELTRAFEHILDEATETFGILERMLVAYGDFALDDAERFRVLFIDREVTKLQLEGSRGLESYELIQQVVERARGEGRLRPLPTATLVRILLASVHGVCVLAFTVREIDFSDARALVRESARVALRGLSSNPRELT